MKIIKAIMTESGIRPDFPAGTSFTSFSSNDNFEGMVCNETEYIFYEIGDELPDSIKSKLIVLRDLDDDLILWRYIDFNKLYSLVNKRALFFTPGYILRNLEPYELRIPVPLALANRKAYSSAFPDAEERFHRFEQSTDHILYQQGISSWHINITENNALWRVFVPNTDGVAIKTTLGRLKRSVKCRRKKIVSDQVEYIDYLSEHYKLHPSAIGYEQTFHKVKFYELSESSGSRCNLTEIAESLEYTKICRKFYVNSQPISPK